MDPVYTAAMYWCQAGFSATLTASVGSIIGRRPMGGGVSVEQSALVRYCEISVKFMAAARLRCLSGRCPPPPTLRVHSVHAQL